MGLLCAGNQAFEVVDFFFEFAVLVFEGFEGGGHG